MTRARTPRETAAADQMAAAVATGQPRMIEMAHLYLRQDADRAAILAQLFTHLMTSPHRRMTVYSLYADALLRLAEAETLAGEPPTPAPPA